MSFTTTLKEENRGLILINHRYWSRKNRYSRKKLLVYKNKDTEL